MIHRPLACQLIFVLRHSGSDHSHAPRGILTFIFQRLHLAWRYWKKTCFSSLTAFTKRERNWEREKFAKHCFHIHYFLAGGTSSKSQRTGISFGMLFYLHCLLASVDKGWTKFVFGGRASSLDFPWSLHKTSSGGEKLRDHFVLCARSICSLGCILDRRRCGFIGLGS